MAIALTDERTEPVDNVHELEPCAALTPRGRAAARLLAFEDAWVELDGADRAYFASELAELARQAEAAQ